MHGARLTRQDRAMKGESETATAGEVRARAPSYSARDPSGLRDAGVRDTIPRNPTYPT